MVGSGRDLCESSSPTPLPKQGHLEQAAQDLVQADFGFLQRRRIHSPSGKPVPGLCHPQSEEVLPHVHLEVKAEDTVCTWWLLKRDFVDAQLK